MSEMFDLRHRGIYFHLPDADADTCLLTCRPKDVELTESDMQALGSALVDAARALRERDESAGSLYYVQFTGQGYVGNCFLLWGKNSSGYTTEIDRAGLYTYEQIRNMRPEDQPWPKEMLEAHIVRHVRGDLGDGMRTADVGLVFDQWIPR